MLVNGIIIYCLYSLVLTHQVVNSNEIKSNIYNQTQARKQETISEKPSLMQIALRMSAREGLDAMWNLYAKTEPQILRSDNILPNDHPGALLSKFSSSALETERSEMAAFAVISAAKAFRRYYKDIQDLARQARPQKISLKRTALEALCPPRDSPVCNPASERYRTHDGTCNNKRRPRWGAAQMPFNRFLPPEYADGVDTIRKAIDGTALPSARFVSLLVHGARPGDAAITLMTAQWGQLLDHDLTSTAQPRPINGSVPSCCGRNDLHPSCFPIKVPFDDPWLAPLKVHCLEFLRSAPAQRRDCVLSWREQTNQATSYIDASPVYSNHVRISDTTRTFQNGTLIYGRGNPALDVCQRGALATQCIRSGDGRSGEQPGLLALHQVWVTEHNRIALQLATMNLHWSDEKIFQETRRIVGAMFQHITYKEFLPIILGRQVAELFNLELMKTGYFKGYDPKVNPTVANSFSAAAFRFGHSLIQNSYMRCDRNHNILPSNVTLHEEFQRGDVGSVGSLHRLIRGMATQKALKRDEFITPELTNHLFQTAGFPFGLDLAAINIQRGRDHGIAPYTAWRAPCGLTPIKNWDDLVRVVGPESTKRIRNAYKSVHDIDLFVGGIAERPVVGGLVGPTFACIIAQQFSNLRVGDRFWYENGDMENSFTPAQLQSIRHVLFSQVLCQTVGGGTLQSHVFIPADVAGNERLPCGVGNLAPLDLRPWKEQDPFVETLTAKPKFPNLDLDLETNSNSSNQQILKKSDVVTQTDLMQSPMTNKTENSGFQLFKNLTKINDKLDITRKQTTKRPKPIKGINNKLDKNRQVNRLTDIPKVAPTKRKVVINNIPLELRSAAPLVQTKQPVTTEKTIKKRNAISEDKNSSKFVFNLTELNPMTHSSPIELKRVQRKLNFEETRNDTIDTETVFSTNKALNSLNKTISTKVLILHPESKQYYADRDYTTPHKVVLPSPHSDEYEIEINIRQTKKPINQDSQYQSFPTTHYNYQTNDQTAASFDQAYTATSPHYATKPQPINNKRTRPPTIIYLNEQEDRFTTKRPGLIQQFMSYTKPLTTQRQQPQYESVVSSGALSVSTATRPSLVDSFPFDRRTQVQSQLPPAASTFNQIGTQYGGGAHVSSAAVSTGTFGSITGSSSANGADTSFSFNIRPKPKPSLNGQKIVNYGQTSPTDNNFSGPDIRPNYMNYAMVSPTSTPNYNSYQEVSNDSPFSAVPKRPHYNYYTRTPNDILDHTENKEGLSDSVIYSGYENIGDYDYFGKSFTLKEQNDTLNLDDFEDYNELVGTDKDKVSPNEEVFNPENMAFYIIQKKERLPNFSEQKDNYVMPILNSRKSTVLEKRTETTTELITSTDISDSFAKNSNTDIFAEDENNLTMTPSSQILETTTVSVVKVPFAPIRILTTPERPDNWIMFAAMKENDSLPESPSLSSESEVALEMPTPFKNLTNIWLTRLMTENENDKEILDDNFDMTTTKEDVTDDTDTTLRSIT